MSKTKSILVTEQQFSDLILKSVFGDNAAKMLDVFKTKDEKNSTDSEDKTDSKKSSEEYKGSLKNTAGEFNQLDLNNSEDFKAYESIANKFISTKSSNLLGITGNMLATSAKNAQNKFGKYVPVELALAQLAAEGGFSKNPNDRPIKTKNPFNVGNTDSGANEFHPSVQSGIQRYYDLIAKNYLVGDKTASDLLRNFVNKNGHRYATSKYEGLVSQIASQVKSMSQPIIASLNKKVSDLT